MVTPLSILKTAVELFEKNECLYCLIGGHAASIYRRKERLTSDVDFALMGIPPERSRTLAQEIIQLSGLEPVLGFIPPSQHESKRKSVCMVTSKPSGNELKGIIDILLPELPWVENAVRRAQSNRINLGFALVPVITPEDLVIAKCYALRNSPDRFQDLDDLKEIFLSVRDLDYRYLWAELKRLGLGVPEVVGKFVKEN